MMITLNDEPVTPEWVLPPREVVETVTIPANIELGSE